MQIEIMSTQVNAGSLYTHNLEVNLIKENISI
jgi:hypothetical protein